MQILRAGKKRDPERFIYEENLCGAAGNVHSQKWAPHQRFVSVQRGAHMPFLMGGGKKRNLSCCRNGSGTHFPGQKNGHIGILIGPRPCTHTNAAQLRAAKLLHQFRHQCFKVPHMLKQAIALAKAPFPLLNRKHRP